MLDDRVDVARRSSGHRKPVIEYRFKHVEVGNPANWVWYLMYSPISEEDAREFAAGWLKKPSDPTAARYEEEAQ